MKKKNITLTRCWHMKLNISESWHLVSKSKSRCHFHSSKVNMHLVTLWKSTSSDSFHYFLHHYGSPLSIIAHESHNLLTEVKLPYGSRLPILMTYGSRLPDVGFFKLCMEVHFRNSSFVTKVHFQNPFIYRSRL